MFHAGSSDPLAKVSHCCRSVVDNNRVFSRLDEAGAGMAAALEAEYVSQLPTDNSVHGGSITDRFEATG